MVLREDKVEIGNSSFNPPTPIFEIASEHLLPNTGWDCGCFEASTVLRLPPTNSCILTPPIWPKITVRKRRIMTGLTNLSKNSGLVVVALLVFCIFPPCALGDEFVCDNAAQATCPGYGLDGLNIMLRANTLIPLNTTVSSGYVMFCEALVNGRCLDPSNWSDVMIFVPDPDNPSLSRFVIFLSDPFNTHLPRPCAELEVAPCTVFLQEPYGSDPNEPPNERDNIALMWRAGMNRFTAFSDGAPVPEPTTFVLLASGLIGIGARRRIRTSR